MHLYQIATLRWATLPLLKFFAFDLKVSSPWVPDAKVWMNSFLHKGYWYHGRERELESMQLFGRLAQRGGTAVEVGGHIGWITSWLADCVGAKGKVLVYEPGSNNLPYIRKNISEGLPLRLSGVVHLVEAAVGDREGTVAFYEDSLTGQNNSLVKDFDGLKFNQSFSYVESDVQQRNVAMVTLDSQLQNENVSFIKIDVEGYEWGVLQGAQNLISRCFPSIMVEVQANQLEIHSYLTGIGYLLFNPSLDVLSSSDDLQSNVFCLHRTHHIELIEELGLAMR